ncbi:hypothetical protein BB934_09575 [Microvirga ossetica]|uniref:Uncharacterized protein n=1 Tax=Microvirga ossetica TaxID=1882682 RepID=A0A1B2EES6_9HYPH|nr:hypothetical protein BB934_09575 [Microvirga ossetica]
MTEREYYLLGSLAEPPSRNRDLHKYTAEAERLIQRGYLKRGQFDVYTITPKGLAAWQAYRFTDS